MKTNPNTPGKFTAAGEIRFQRLLPGPIERVWEYLTVPEKRATWLARGPFDARPGGDITLEFHNSKLSAPGDAIPAKYQTSCRDGVANTGRVLECQPPHRLSHTWCEDDGSASEVVFELKPQGRDVLLILVHRKLGNERAVHTSVGAGWHTHLAILVANLEGTPPPSFWTTHTKLEADYEKILDRATP